MKSKIFTAVAALLSVLFFVNTGCNSGQSATDSSFKDSTKKKDEAGNSRSRILNFLTKT
jgi:hypothetical protein